MPAHTRPLLMASALLAFFFTTPAHAGFQWTAPASNAGSIKTQPAPVAPVMSENLPSGINDIQSQGIIPTMPDGPASAAPIYGPGMTNDPITWNNTYSSAKRARAPQNIMPSMQQQQPAPPQTSLYALDAAPVSMSSYEIAEGFGTDLPLVMAVRQIVPSQYGFVFDDGIDLNTRVSWQGGEPWDIVLSNTLANQNLGVSIRDNVVSITRRNAPMAAPMQSASMTMDGQYMAANGNMATPMAAIPVSMVAGSDMMDAGYVATPAKASAATLASTASWTAARNSSLRGILEDWTNRVGVELYWASEYDYPIQSAVNIQGTFEEAVQILLKGLSESRPRPTGRLHPNLPEGPAVLVIETRQNSM